MFTIPFSQEKIKGKCEMCANLNSVGPIIGPTELRKREFSTGNRFRPVEKKNPVIPGQARNDGNGGVVGANCVRPRICDTA